MSRAPARRRVTRRMAYRVALGVALAPAIFTFLLSAGLPYWWQQHGQQMVTITTGSMMPTINPGDSVLIRARTPATIIRAGQIVTFASGPVRTLTSHRVVEVLTLPGQPGRWLRTKGDANPTPDPVLTRDSAVVGVVETHLHWLGPLLTHAQQPVWRLGAFGPAMLLFAAAEIPALFGRGSDDEDSDPEPSTAAPADGTRRVAGTYPPAL